ncbi:MAG TPA: carboxypeptidase regulatory-like domain-containing protein [Candidatus Acidoferrum sp.]|nr:carboxypeptidase regulatory-like domain-containing protein [Candidatus Acidoferrum sp.]
MMVPFLILALLLVPTPTNSQSQVAAGYRISGMVVDAVTQGPVGRAQVSISLGNDTATTTAGDDGRFVFAGLQPGKYVLNATAPGYVREGYHQHGSFFVGIAVGDGQDSEHLIFRLHPQAVIYGRVTDERGGAVRGAQVLLIASDLTRGGRPKFVRAQMPTNDLGEYRFAHLNSGKYYLAVQAHPWYAQSQLSSQTRQAPGFVGSRAGSSFVSRISIDADPILDVVYPITFYSGVTDERSSEELALDAGQQEQANITLHAVPAVHLRLTGLSQSDGSSLNVGATQRVFGALSLGLGITFGQVSPGEYEVAGLPPGQLTFAVTTNKENQWTSRTIEADSSLGGVLDASALQTTAKVSGRILLPAGAADTRAADLILVSNTATTWPGANAPLQSDGTFQFPGIQPGTYKIQVNLRAGGYYVQKVSAKNAEVSGREITITGASDVNLTVTMGQGLGEVTGVVQLDGKPIAGVMVLLVPESGLEMDEDSRMDESDSDGTFRLAGILPGEYILLAIKDGWDVDWAKPEALKPYLSAGQKVTIAPNQSVKITALAREKTEKTEKVRQ